ncbi:MAG TPA: hypothetical protein VHB74_14275 [Devosia sp.]|nr:hypothetical protein [Devosia sp.]
MSDAEASAQPTPAPATTDRERAAIDSGAAGDKIAFPDPAAAPLGTDAEASGAPPTAAERRMDQKSLSFPPARPPAPVAPSVVWLSVGIVVFALAMVLIALYR